MPTQIRLTKRSIDAIAPPPSGQVYYRDQDLRGFGLRVGRRAKAFFVERQVKRRTVRTTIGQYSVLSPEQARTEALRIMGLMAAGRDPNAENAARKAGVLTLRQTFDEFFDAKKGLSPKPFRITAAPSTST